MCAKSLDRHTWCLIALCLFCLVILFSDLGAAALFEPDEGRNAEVAREILLLRDWVTPHYDFIPRLDKPVFFFGLVALSFKLFGLGEWSARLPSPATRFISPAAESVWRAAACTRWTSSLSAPEVRSISASSGSVSDTTTQRLENARSLGADGKEGGTGDDADISSMDSGSS